MRARRREERNEDLKRYDVQLQFIAESVVEEGNSPRTQQEGLHRAREGRWEWGPLAASAQTSGPHLSQIRKINNIQMPTTTARFSSQNAGRNPSNQELNQF